MDLEGGGLELFEGVLLASHGKTEKVTKKSQQSR
jgi:hypothetical protein